MDSDKEKLTRYGASESQIDELLRYGSSVANTEAGVFFGETFCPFSEYRSELGYVPEEIRRKSAIKTHRFFIKAVSWRVPAFGDLGAVGILGSIPNAASIAESESAFNIP